MRFPSPLRPGDTIAVTAPSSGLRPSYLPRYEVACEALRARGYQVRTGECLVAEDGGVPAPAPRRAAELTALLLDPEVAAVVPPWGGELAIDVLEHLDWAALADADPTWLVGYSDVTTVMLPLATRLGWASLHGANLLETPYAAPEGLWHWVDVLEATGPVTQRSPGRHHVGAWDDWEGDPTIASRELAGEGRWEVVGGGGLDVTGRLIGGCVETIAPLVGTPYGDVPALGESLAEDGLLVYVEVCEHGAFDVARELTGMRLAGWFDEATAVLVGRSAAPDSPGLTQREAVLGALGPLEIPVVLGVDIGHVAPNLPVVNGALARVVVDDRRAEITQEWAAPGVE